MHTYSHLPAPSTPALPAPSKPFLRTNPYAPRPKTRRPPDEKLVRWEDEGGSLAEPPST